MGDDVNRFVGGARQGSPNECGLEVRHHLDIKRRLHVCRLTRRQRCDQIPDRETVIASNRECRRPGIRWVALITHVAGQHVDLEDSRRTLLIRTFDRVLVVVAEHRVGEHGFACQVLAHEVGGASHSSVHGLDIDAGRRERGRPIVGLRGIECDRLAAARHRHLPFLREPLRTEIQRLDANVTHPEGLERVREPRRAFRIGGAPDDASPELGMTLIAIPPRDRRLLLDVAVQMSSVDPAVGLFSGG